ncbi:hypothetical protein PB2503_05002 [Parvularcula bermudensis HTCC2503]|uniref:Uncharacterized protein n=1 Tax=Parvularcula bermudensis (strain ATCC BAA-594 / HTCC2503 / KCTC 12087) TaxID=314260 RepID=E0TFR0_PARBH|nr:hypothetical protein [Parvularcula bermudensis]ADM09075.1 hypothetical protein PB2503_05002 [Parvularcula bermudensis HTCC2503]
MRELPMTDNGSMDRLRDEATDEQQHHQGHVTEDDAKEIAEQSDVVDEATTPPKG